MLTTELMKLDSRQRLNMGRVLKDPTVNCVKLTDMGNGRYIIDTVSEVKTNYEEALKHDPQVLEIIRKAEATNEKGMNPIPEDIIAIL